MLSGKAGDFVLYIDFLCFTLPFLPSLFSYPSSLSSPFSPPPYSSLPSFSLTSSLPPSPTHEIWKFSNQNLRNTNSKAVKTISKAWILNLLKFHTCMPGGWNHFVLSEETHRFKPILQEDLVLWLPLSFNPVYTFPNSPSLVHGLNQPSRVDDQETAAPASISEMPWGKFTVSANSEWESRFLICPSKKRSKTWLI